MVVALYFLFKYRGPSYCTTKAVITPQCYSNVVPTVQFLSIRKPRVVEKSNFESQSSSNPRMMETKILEPPWPDPHRKSYKTASVV